MWSNISATGALALLGVVTARVAIMIVALRGTKPSERPAIIRALNEGMGRALPQRRKRRGIRRQQ